jgi:RNA polymerase sigma-70 factor (ECF subfamily)
VREDDEAEDVMQDAYVRAFAHLRDFSGAATFGGWLTRIAVNEALARVRRRKRFDSFDERESEDTMAANDRSPEQGASDVELRGVLERAIDALPEVFRTVFVLRMVEDMSTLEAAECLDIPEDTVKTRLFRARALLREELVYRFEKTATSAFRFERPRCDRVVANVLQRVERR